MKDKEQELKERIEELEYQMSVNYGTMHYEEIYKEFCEKHTELDKIKEKKTK